VVVLFEGFALATTQESPAWYHLRSSGLQGDETRQAWTSDRSTLGRNDIESDGGMFGDKLVNLVLGQFRSETGLGGVYGANNPVCCHIGFVFAAGLYPQFCLYAWCDC